MGDASAGQSDPDRDLMLRVRDGDADAFRALFERHLGAISRFAENLVGNPARAEELAQDVFLQVYRARETYEPRARFTTWLYTIAHNLCLNELRRPEHRWHSVPIGPAEEEGALALGLDLADPEPGLREGEAAASGQELVARLRALLADLPEAQRSALLLSRVKDLRYQEIGEILGCSELAVKSLIFRATRRLKEGLKGYSEGTG